MTTIIEVISMLNASFPHAFEVQDKINHETTLAISTNQLCKIVALIRADFPKMHLSTITAQIFEDNDQEIQVMYHFWHRGGLTLSLQLPLTAPTLPTIADQLPGADFYEREVAEMYGVRFTGRENTPKLLLPDDWDQSPPMRKLEKEE